MFDFIRGREIVETCNSELNGKLEVVRIGDHLQLNASNTNYSYGGLHRVFRKAFEKVGISEKRIPKVLLLGFGAGSVAEILLEELEMNSNITAVEKDPEVIRLARQYFNIGRFVGLELIEDDAASFILRETKKYDLIIIDVYVDFEVPQSCMSKEFVENLFKCLREDGMVLFNKMIYNHEASEEADALEARFRDLPGRTSVLKIRETLVNKMIVYENNK